VQQLAGSGRSTIYKEIGAGRLTAVLVGRAVAVMPDALAAWIASLEDRD
jgi:hypothetical protein